MRLTSLIAGLVVFAIWAEAAQAWTWPTTGEVLRPFVFADDPYAGGLHRGVDIAGEAGDSVLAPAGGRVSFAGTVPGSGPTVTLRTSDGYSVTLVHLGAISVERGDLVAEGAPVGRVGLGSPAEWPRPYVHFGVRVTAERHGYVDPLTLLPSRRPTVGPGAPFVPTVAPAAVAPPVSTTTAAPPAPEVPHPQPAVAPAPSPVARVAPTPTAGGLTAPPPPAASAKPPAATGVTPRPSAAPPPGLPAAPVAPPVATTAPTPASPAAGPDVLPGSSSTPPPQGGEGAVAPEAPAETGTGAPPVSAAEPPVSPEGSPVIPAASVATPAAPAPVAKVALREPRMARAVSPALGPEPVRGRQRHDPAPVGSSRDEAPVRARTAARSAGDARERPEPARTRAMLRTAAPAAIVVPRALRDTPRRSSHSRLRRIEEASGGNAPLMPVLAVLVALALGLAPRRSSGAGGPAVGPAATPVLGVASAESPSPVGATCACSARRSAGGAGVPCRRIPERDPLAALLAPPRRRPAPQPAFRGRRGRAVAASHRARRKGLATAR